ncbi:MAG TPA: DUF4870 domain-containing protein [Acidobacteriota bacterium]|nr:DUF4870 domain-containing protein [Acidobacteriota bacterium]
MNEPIPNRERDARTWAAFCHLAAFGAFLVPFGHIIGPLVVWLVKRHEHPFIDEQGREAVNFQITLTLIFAALVFCLIFLALIMLPVLDRQPGLVFLFIPVAFLLPVVALTDFILILVATIRAGNGQPHRYPLNLRLIRG